MILLDERARTEALDNEIILRSLREITLWRKLAERYIGRALFYRELCVLQQKSLAEERAANARLRTQLRDAKNELQMRMGVRP